MKTHISTLYVMFLVCNACLGMLFFGYSLTYLNSIFPQIDQNFNIQEQDKQYIHGLLSACIPFGAGLGALCASHMLSILSKRRSMIFTDIIGIAGCVLSVYPDLDVFILARMIIGFTTGLNSAIVVIYVTEYSPQSIAGPMGTLTSVFIQLGMLLSFLVSKLSTDIIFTIPLITCITRIAVLLWVFKYDPPSSYLSEDRNMAIEAASQIYYQDFISETLDKYEKDTDAKQVSISYSDLFSQKSFMVGCGLSVLQQLAGINAVVFYSSDIFEKVAPEQVYNLNLMIPIVAGIASFVAGLFLRKITKKKLLLIGSVVCCILLLFLYYISRIETSNMEVKILLLINLYMYLFAFNCTLGPVVWLYIPDILPDKGVSMATLVNWWTATIVAQGFPTMVASFGISRCFLMFSTFSLLGSFFVNKLVPNLPIKNYTVIKD